MYLSFSTVARLERSSWMPPRLDIELDARSNDPSPGSDVKLLALASLSGGR
jgi:hypothetical protein